VADERVQGDNVEFLNQVVSTDRLLEFLWPGQPPESAANTLQTYVSHLRRSLEPDRMPRQRSRLLITREPGYLLALDRDQIDAVRFERLVGQARPVLGSAPQVEDVPVERPVEAILGSAREAVRRCRWQEAFNLLCAADERGGLGGEDLDALAEVAFWLGRPHQSHVARQRAHGCSWPRAGLGGPRWRRSC
jgi:hypothetical protein